ncbi:MAG: ankyrin repeat domain-containing protein [Alphaproteobacteria bacterium]
MSRKLETAVRAGDVALATQLIDEGANPNRHYAHSLPLVITANTGDVAMTKMLLEKGADPERVDNNGTTPFGIALWRQHPAVAHALLDAGANPLPDNDNGNTGWTWALSHQYKDIIERMLEKGVDINQTDCHGSNCLTGVGLQKEYEFSGWLLEKGADPNFMNKKFGYTPLHIACQHDNPAATKWLADVGARLDVTNSDGLTPVEFARKYHNPKALAVLLQVEIAREGRIFTEGSPVPISARRPLQLKSKGDVNAFC